MNCIFLRYFIGLGTQDRSPGRFLCSHSITQKRFRHTGFGPRHGVRDAGESVGRGLGYCTKSHFAKKAHLMSSSCFISFKLSSGFPPLLYCPLSLETNYIPERLRSGDKGLDSGFRHESVLQRAYKTLQVGLRVERLMMSDGK